MFELFSGPHATLLLFGPDTDGASVAPIAADTKVVRILVPGSESGTGEFVDSDGHAQRAYSAADGTRVLVRPDGYVGFIDG